MPGAFPDPESDFHALYDELNREPLRVPTANGRDTVLLHGVRLVTGITDMLDARARLQIIPFLIHELRRGDRLRAARALALNPSSARISIALNALVNCYEHGEVPRSVADSANTVPLPPFRIRLDPDACALWRTKFATDAERAPVRSDIPTLILVGEYDARTPPENARRIAETLTHAFVYELPGIGHGNRPACLQDIMRQFVEKPTREPDASCIARMPKLSFATRWPES